MKYRVWRYSGHQSLMNYCMNHEMIFRFTTTVFVLILWTRWLSLVSIMRYWIFFFMRFLEREKKLSFSLKYPSKYCAVEIFHDTNFHSVLTSDINGSRTHVRQVVVVEKLNRRKKNLRGDFPRTSPCAIYGEEHRSNVLYSTVDQWPNSTVSGFLSIQYVYTTVGNNIYFVLL